MRLVSTLLLLILGSIVPGYIVRFAYRAALANGSWDRAHILIVAAAAVMEFLVLVAALTMQRRPRFAEWCAAGGFAVQALAFWLVVQANAAALH